MSARPTLVVRPETKLPIRPVEWTVPRGWIPVPGFGCWVSSALTKFTNAVSHSAIVVSTCAISCSSSCTRSSICLRFRGLRRRDLDSAAGGMRTICRLSQCWIAGYRGLEFLRATLFTPHVVFVVAGIDFDLAVAYFEDARGQLVDEISVVRNEDYGAGVLLTALPARRLLRACRGGWWARRATGNLRDEATFLIMHNGYALHRRARRCA